MKRMSLRLIVGAVCLPCCVLAGGGDALAATVTWNSGSSATWFTAGNWSPAALPTSADTTIINSGASASLVDATGAVASIVEVGTTVAGGTLTVQSGGSLSDTTGYVGYSAGSSGTATVTGTGSSWANTSNLYVGRYGSATLAISSGGSVTNVYGYVGYYSGSTGTVTVSGLGSSWTNSSGIQIGHQTAGTVNVMNNGSISSGGNLILGVHNGSSGTLNVSSGGSITSGPAFFSDEVGTTGTATISGAESNWVSNNHFYVGYYGAGFLNVQDGASVSNVKGYIGHFSGSIGTVTISDVGSSWSLSSGLYVGESSSGTLSVQNGGAVSNVGCIIGYDVGSTGAAVITGSGSTWTNTGNLFVGNYGTGELTIEDDALLTVSGGVIIANRSGISGTLNIGAAAGDAAAASGTLDADSVVFGAGTGTLVFNINDVGAYTFDPAMSGSGTVNVKAGTIVFSGDSSGFTGAMQAASGVVLESNGGMGGTLTVASGATVQGTGAIGATTLASGATIKPGVSQSGTIGTLSVSGDYTQNAGASMIATLSPSDASALVVNGTAAIDGTITITPQAGTYYRARHYLVSANSLSGTFSTVTNTAPGIVEFDVTYTGSAVALTIDEGQTNLATNADTGNQTGLAFVLDALSASTTSGSFDTVLTEVASLAPADQAEGLDQLTSLAAPQLASAASGNLQAVFGSIGARLAGGSGHFTLAEDFGLKGEVQVADASGLYWGPDRGSQSDYTVWMQGVGGTSNLHVSGGDYVSSTMGGVTLGIEAQPSRYKRIGIATGVVQTNMSLNGGTQEVEQQSYMIGLYGSRVWDKLEADGSVLLSYNQAESRRTIVFMGQRADGHTDGYGVGFDAGLSYRMELDDDETTLTPRIGLGYTYNWENGYTETGAPGANLSIRDSDHHFLKTAIGATLSSKHTVWRENNHGILDTVRPHLSLGWQHDVLNPVASVGASFADVGASSFTTTGANPGRDAVTTGAGFSYTPGDQPTLSLYARYDAALSAHQGSHTLTGGVKYSW
ncbi:MAG: autotransporter domain-containing protein [Bdellovibrionales bacterium]